MTEPPPIVPTAPLLQYLANQPNAITSSELIRIIMATVPVDSCAYYTVTADDVNILSGKTRTAINNKPIERELSRQQRSALYICAYDARHTLAITLVHGRSSSHFITIPLLYDRRVRGIIVVMRKRVPFTSADVDIFQQAVPLLADLVPSLHSEAEQLSGQAQHNVTSAAVTAATEVPQAIPLAVSTSTTRKRGRPRKSLTAVPVEGSADAAPSPEHIFFAASSEGMLQITKDFRITQHNPAFTRLTGWDNTVIGQRCSEIIQCHDHNAIPYCGTVYCPIVALSPATDRQTTTQDVRMNTSWQQPHYRTMRVHTVTSAPITVLLMREIGSVLIMQQQHEEFLAGVVHQLRNRLNAVHGLIELVASGHAGAITDQQHEMLGYAHTSAVEMMEYIENLLYLMRVDAGQAFLSPMEFTLGNFLAEIERYTALEVTLSHVTFTITKDYSQVIIYADHAQLRRAMLNLMTNALKFTPAGGSVTLAGVVQDDRLFMSVTDTGLGITAADLPQIFSRNFHSERMAALGKSGGSMGLATARAIITQHAGTITCTSVVDQGTTFIVTLPLRQ